MDCHGLTRAYRNQKSDPTHFVLAAKRGVNHYLQGEEPMTLKYALYYNLFKSKFKNFKKKVIPRSEGNVAIENQ